MLARLQAEKNFFARHTPPQKMIIRIGGLLTETSDLCRIRLFYTIPWAIMASATLRKPATFAPTIRSPGLPHSTEAS